MDRADLALRDLTAVDPFYFPLISKSEIMLEKFDKIMDPIMAVLTWIGGIGVFYWIFLRWAFSLFL